MSQNFIRSIIIIIIIMALEVMSNHQIIALSPMFSSPMTRCKPIIRTNQSPVAKNLFDQTTSLPLVKRTSHPDLKRISAQTLVKLLEEQRDDLLIIDARYPFEYAGGHIASAQNIYTENDLRRLFSDLIFSSTRPSTIVFHCEFSSERGPRLCRLFRSLDRQLNMSNYPELSFPSIYLLDGGYAEFFTHVACQRFCEPKSYVSMFEESFSQELKIYRHAKKIAHGRIIKQNFIEEQGPIQFCLS